MMMVKKYQIAIEMDNVQHVTMYKNAKILKITSVANDIIFWTLVDTKIGFESRWFDYFITNQKLPSAVDSKYSYIDTIRYDLGINEIHVFEIQEEQR